ncbi:MAG TPA: hypothetical protein VFB14_16950 [Bryobacteraceae bacterium]|jgi:hypothetical protein|nr:hypothetical protein [Bryobacteraceae bacterium]
MSLQPENRRTFERLRRSTRLLLTIGLLAGTAIPVVAGIRGPGKYSGIVFYDRWDNCILFDGAYLMYISERVKERLRSHQSQCVDIYAEDVYQPVNPGDGLIREFTFLGSCTPKPVSLPLTGIELKASRDSVGSTSATLIVDIRNTGLSDVVLNPDALGFAVLAPINNRALVLNPSDGPSFAVITRVSLASPAGQSELEFDGVRKTYAWYVPQSYRLRRC